MAVRRMWWLLAMGGVSLVVGLLSIPTSAAADGAWTRSPGSGPAGTAVTVTGVTPCPQPPPPTPPAVGDPDVSVRFFFEAGQETFVGEVDADDATGAWSGTITIPNDTAPGSKVLHGFCNRIVSAPGSCNGDLCLPGTDGQVDYFTYAPQSFDVTAAGGPAMPPHTLPPPSEPAGPPPTFPTPPPAGSPSGVTPNPFVAPPDAVLGYPFTGPVGGAPTPGGTIMVSEPGFNPGETVQGVLYSTPTHLGSIKADALGRVIGSLPVPLTTPPGLHTLSLIGGNLVKSRTVEIVGPQLASGSGRGGTALAASGGQPAGLAAAAASAPGGGIADAKAASAKSKVPGSIPRTGPIGEPRDLAPTAALITLAGALWVAAARQYRLAVGDGPQPG